MNELFPIGWHLGPGGNAVGLGADFMVPLDMAGIRFCIKATDDYPQDAVDIARASGIKHTIVYRDTDLDVPNYALTPELAAQEHFANTMSQLPPEFDRSIVWLEAINEVDKNRSNWLGFFGAEWARLAQPEGLKVAMFGWSSGEPEPEHWLEPGMQAFLQLAASRPAELAVSLHEYSFDINDIYRWYPWLIGRYRLLFAACDQIGIPRVTTIITEWGWEAANVPDEDPALIDIDNIAQEYVQHKEIIGAALWYLGPGYGEIADRAQPLIAPVGNMALNWSHYVDHGDPPPPSGDCLLIDQFEKTHILRPQSMTANQWTYIKDAMTNGVELPDVGHRIIGYEGWSHLDAIGSIRASIDAGYSGSRLVIVDGHLIGTGLDQAWMSDNCPLMVPYTAWLQSDGAPAGPFKFDAWPTEYMYVNRFWGCCPEIYAQYGLPGHEGVDIRAYHNTKIFAVAPGYISDIHPIVTNHNYGIFIRVQHQDDYETTYAHLLSISPGLAIGSPVVAGQELGRANNTGNSFGDHLHLTLKRHGHTYTDEHGEWPLSIHDPTPFLEPLCPACFASEPPPVASNARLGLHASADPGLAAGEIGMFQQANIELVKVLSNLPEGDVSSLASALPSAPFVIRAYLSFKNPDGTPRVVSPTEFVQWTLSDVQRTINRLGGRDIIVELHNEPNLVPEGLGGSWANGLEFGPWLLQVLNQYRAALPNIAFAYPGLSPGGNVPGLREDNFTFITGSSNAVSACDYLAVHAYWASNWPMAWALDVVDEYRSRFPGKPIIVTEASNNKAGTIDSIKGQEYITFWQALRGRPDIYGVTYFIGSASNPDWGWESGSGEIWLGTNIPAIVGSR
jgi:hypothetical protein